MSYRIPILCTSAVSALVLAAAPASAGDTQGWDVSALGKSCTMLSTYADDVSVGLVLTHPGDVVSFMAAGDGIGKMTGKPGTITSLSVKFDGAVPHTEWTDNVAKVVSLGGNRIAVVSDWGADLSKELTNTVASSGKVTISIGGKELGTYDLAGSRAASEALTRCGAQLAGK